MLPALPGALLGVPPGIGLFAAAAGGAHVMTVSPAWWLVAALPGTPVAVAGLTAVPASDADPWRRFFGPRLCDGVGDTQSEAGLWRMPSLSSR